MSEEGVIPKKPLGGKLIALPTVEGLNRQDLILLLDALKERAEAGEIRTLVGLVEDDHGFQVVCSGDHEIVRLIGILDVGKMILANMTSEEE